MTVSLYLTVVRAQEVGAPDTYGTHDPSIIKSGDYYYVYSTGFDDFGDDEAIEIRRSTDLYDWEYLGSVLDAIPSWVQNRIPGVSNLWAPDPIYHNGKYYINYSASTFGSQNSVIALLSNVTLDPSSPDYEWVDERIIISSDWGDSYNAIDGAFTEAPDGSMWMSFGSFWSGVKLTSLDSETMKPDTSPATIYSIANRQADPDTDAIEASYIIYRNGYYYLFVNWDKCCQGSSSTYNIRIGRSTDITGPYYDKDGVSMMDGGGTLLLDGGDRWKGPGHASIVKVNGQEFMPHHAYDAYYGGWCSLRVKYLNWDADQWPVLGDYVTSGITEGGTMAHWDFEEGTAGATFYSEGGAQDSSGNGYTMYGSDDVNGPVFSEAGDGADGSGLSATFNGAQRGYTTDTRINGWSPVAWTIEVSVELNDISGWRTMIGRGGSSQGEPEADFYLQKNGVVDANNGVPGAFRVNFDTIGDERYVLDGNFVPAAGQWYHLVVVSDGNTVKMYADKLDGKGYQLAGSLEMAGVMDEYNALAASAYDWTFGCGWYDGSFVDHIDGNLDDIRFTNEALLPHEFLHYEPLVVSETDGSTEVIEHGPTSDMFYVRLYGVQGEAAIEDNVTVDISTDGQVEVDPSQLIFTPSTWDTNQPVDVTAVDDEQLESDPHLSHISFTLTSDDSRYGGVDVDDLLVDVYDDECGAWGYMPYDLDGDCLVDLEDYSLFAPGWMQDFELEQLQQFVDEWLMTTEPYAEGAVKQ